MEMRVHGAVNGAAAEVVCAELSRRLRCCPWAYP